MPLPTAASGQGLIGRYTIRWNETISATSIVLVDTLTKGFHYDLRSIAGGDSCAAGGTGASGTLRLELRPRPSGGVDSIEILIRPDSALVHGRVAVRPRLVLGYRERRDAVIEAGKPAVTFHTSPTSPREEDTDLVPSQSLPANQSHSASIGREIPGDACPGTRSGFRRDMGLSSLGLAYFMAVKGTCCWLEQEIGQQG